MTDKQPDALLLADEADTAEDAGYTSARKANAYYLCLLSDCSQMMRRQHAEIEALRMGYNAARLEIESRKAQHTGAAYAALPEPDATTVGLGAVWNRHSMRDFADATCALRASHGQAPAQAAPAAVAGPSEWCAGVEAAAKMLSKKADDFALEHGRDDMGGLSFGSGAHADAKLEYHSTLLELAEEIRSLAPTPPAQAADSVTAPAGGGVVAPSEPTSSMYRAAQMILLPTGDDDGGSIMLNTSQVRALWQAMLAAAPTTQPAPQQEPILYDQKALLEVFQTAQAGSSSTAGTLRGIAAVVASWESRPDPHTWLIAAPQPSTAAQEDALDAARLDWLLWKLPGDAIRYVVGELADTADAAEFRAAIDAARAAQEGKSHDN